MRRYLRRSNRRILVGQLVSLHCVPAFAIVAGNPARVVGSAPPRRFGS
jgi:acetyltransferase-like isoleucine patch superfamily enzyme